jgi:hypothetical protein
MNKHLKERTRVINAKARWGRPAYLELYGNKVIFDDSDGEYGPIEFSLSVLEEAILTHKQKIKNEDKTAAQSRSDQTTR